MPKGIIEPYVKCTCEQCGKERYVRPKRAVTFRYCSHICSGLADRGKPHHWAPWPKGKKRGSPSAEHRARNAVARLGKPIHSEEHRKKLSENCRYYFTGGAAAVDFAKFLCPAGYVRELHVQCGKGHNQRYRLDFAHPEAKIDIELDGISHQKRLEHDNLRDSRLRDLGWKVIRIKLWA